jgi:recombination protein RecA
MMANAQKRYPDRMGVWVEWENTLDLDWAIQQGVDLDKLIILQPETTEQGMDMIDALIRSKGAHLIVVDSIAAMLPSKELEISFEDATMGLAGLLNSRFFRKITQALRYHRSLTEENPAKTTVLLTNQLRDKLGSYGNPEIMPGGKALRYHSAVIVWLRQGDFLTKKVAGKDVKIGQVINFRSKKNKTSAPQREGEFDYYFTRSNGFEPGQIDRAKEIITYAILWGVIRKNHGWYYIGEDGMNGKEAVYEYLMNNPEKREAIEATVLEIAATQELKEDEEDDTDN